MRLYELRWKWDRFIFNLKRYTIWSWQRAHRGYSDSDVWNFSDVYPRMVVGVLRQLRDEHIALADHGYKICVFGGGEDHDCEELYCYDRYMKIINDIIDGFQLWIDKDNMKLVFENENQLTYDNGEYGQCRHHAIVWDKNVKKFVTRDVVIGDDGRMDFTVEEQAKYDLAIKLLGEWWPSFWN